MNTYIEGQILGIIGQTKVFEQSCRLAAMKDDGKISREEAKELAKISKAIERFQQDLKKIIE